MLALWLLSVCAGVSAFRSPYPRGADVEGGSDAGAPLFLTPYIEAGKIAEARALARVEPLVGDVESYSGFLTVDEACGSNMFVWFFPAANKDPHAPVALWLQGGPGATSLYGLFSEIGPFMLTPDDRLTLRKYSWNRAASYLFVDNPVGTGYSFTGNESCYSTDQDQVGGNLLVALKQFFRMFPEHGSNPFFVTGESYGGKYVPAVSHAIHKDRDAGQRINLQGLAIGNGLVDPANQLHYSDYLYQIGLIDGHGRKYVKDQEDKCRGFIQAEHWRDAFDCFDRLLNGDKTPSGSYFRNITGFTNYFNFLYSAGEPEGNLTALVTKDEVRRSIHVGGSTWHSGSKVETHLVEDVMKSVRPWLEELLEHYRVLVYNGQLDIIVAYPLTESYLQKLNWSAAEEYKTAKRRVWKVGQEIAGYTKTAGRLTEVLVRNAGHMVPMDQPKWAFDLISRFLSDKPFH